jgi:c-di-GMP-binding flagellar brake protein YcgR
VRIPEKAPISYEVMSDAKTADFITKDISQGGVRFFVHEFIPKDSLLKIRLTFQKMIFSFEAIVRVVWIKEDHLNERYEVGVEFVNISKKATEHLIGYIEDILRIG